MVGKDPVMAATAMTAAETVTSVTSVTPVTAAALAGREAAMPRLRRLLDRLRRLIADRRIRAERLELLGLDEHRLRDIGVPESMLTAARGRRDSERRQRERDRLERIGW